MQRGKQPSRAGGALFRAGRTEEGLPDRLFLATLDGVREPADLVGVDFVGSADLGPEGTVAFFVGRDCTVTEEGSDRCALELMVADAFSSSRVELGDIDLSFENPRNPKVRIGAQGEVYFSLRGSRDEPTLLRYREGQIDTILTADQEIDGSALTRPEIQGVNLNEQFLLRAAFANDEPPRPSLLGVLDERSFRVLAIEGVEEARGVVTDIDALGMTDAGQVLYLVTISVGSGEELERVESLRLGDGVTSIELATQDAPFLDFDLGSVESQIADDEILRPCYIHCFDIVSCLLVDENYRY